MAPQSEVEPCNEADQDHRPWPHSQAEKPLEHFFKIILPSTVDEKKLRIPTKFVSKYGDQLSDAAHVIIPNGRIWKVGLRKVQNEIWFDDGWHDFVEHHSICNGYFLVFGYRGLSSFSIFIFDMSACEIEYPCNDQGPVSGEKYGIRNQGHYDDSVDVFRSSLKRKGCDSSSRKGESSKLLPPSEQNPSMTKRNRCMALNAKLRPCYVTRNNKVEMEQFDAIADIDGIELSREQMDGRKISCSHEVNELKEGKGSKIKFGRNVLLPKSEEDTEIITTERFELSRFSPACKKAIQAARKYNPKHPSFLAVLSPSNCYRSMLYVPMKFSEGYLSKALEYIKVEVSDGREWTIGLRRSCNRVHLGRGLNEFFEDNNLKAGDVCVFELIKNNMTLKASIFHADAVHDEIEIITSSMFEFTEESQETKMAIDVARKYNYKHPAFMVVIRPYNCFNSALYVPRKFCRMYLGGARKYIEVEVSDGREWTIGFQGSRQHLSFGQGWNEFRVDNNLKAGDVCIFELIKDREVMRASIFHAVKDAGPED